VVAAVKERKTKTSKQMSDMMQSPHASQLKGVEEQHDGLPKDLETMAAALGMSPDGLHSDHDRVTAKVANQNRASFHEKTRNFLYGMASQIFGSGQQGAGGQPGETGAHPEQGSVALGLALKPEQAIKNKFAYRKDYDRLKLLAKRRELRLRKLDEDLAILQEVDDCSEVASQNAEMQLRKLGMKLNTVMIKISEAERSKRTYELNIVHIKDESQENHKQLDSLRRNLFLQQNLKKKISKFKDYALKQKEFAVTGLKEFNAELADWRNFLDFQYRHLASLAKKDETPRDKKQKDEDEEAKGEAKKGGGSIHHNEKKQKKRQKAMNRIQKLKKLVEGNEKEIAKLSEKLLQFENDINFFDERFKRIYNATGLSSTDKIINKFFVNKEIHSEQNALLQELYAARTEREAESEALEEQLKVLHANNNDHTWREIDMLQETLSKKKHTLASEKQQAEKIQLEFTLLAEWMHVIMANLQRHLRHYQVDDRMQRIDATYNTATASHDTRQQVNRLEEYIQVMLDIIDDIESGTFAIKQKEIMAHDAQTRAEEDELDELDTPNIDSSNLLGSNLNANQGAHAQGQAKSTKKKTRKSKYAK